MKVSDDVMSLCSWMKQPQNFSVNDGNGIRTTLFLKGCPLRCQWCANPECLVSEPVDGIESFTIEQVLKIIDKQKIFYRHSGGGVTFSGGEATVQYSFLDKLSEQLYDQGIDLALETSAFFNFEKINATLKRMDLIFVDIKLMDNERHKHFTGKGNQLILENIIKIAELDSELIIRIPVIEGVNADDDNVNETARFIKQHLKVPKIELLPYHSLGNDKYQQLGLTRLPRTFTTPSADKIQQLENMIEAQGVSIVHY